MPSFRAFAGVGFSRKPRVFAMLLALAGCFAWSGSLSAQLPVARLYSVFPLGAKHGATVDVTLTGGADLEGARALRFTHPGITAVQKTQMVQGKDEPQPVPNQFVVTIASDVPPGVYELRCVGRFGISNPRAFVVSDRDEVIEVEPNDEPTQAMAVTPGTIVNGRSDKASDLDYFKLTASQGQRVIIDCWAERIDSRLDGTLTLFDANGQELATNRDFNRRDPLIDFTAPTDGEYVVRLNDFLYAGGSEQFYRLSFRTGPYVDFVFPPSAAPGTKQTFAIFGRNLPGGQPVEGLMVGGNPLERVDVEIDVPGGAAETRLESDLLVAPEGAFIDGFTYRLPSDQGESNPVFIPFATAPLVAEQEPNDEPAQAQRVAVPCEYVGQIGHKQDDDWLVFDAKKGEVFWMEVLCQRMGMPADPQVRVERVVTKEDGTEQVSDLKTLDDSGANIGGASFNTTSVDPTDRFVVPEDGTYRVVLHDLDYYTSGHARIVYRLSIRHETPDFRLVALAPFPNDVGKTPNPWTALVRKGGTERLQVFAFRRDGFAGEIRLAVEGLPEGVTSAGATIGPGQNDAILVFTASEQAAAWSGQIKVIGTATIGDSEVRREARGGAVLWTGAQNLEVGARITDDVVLAVGEETAPMLLQAGVDSLTVPQSHQLNLPITLTRRDDSKADIALTPYGVPGNTQTNTVTLKGDASQITVPLFIQNNATAGTYTFFVQGSTKISYTKNADGSDKKDVDIVDGSTPISLTIIPGPLTIAPKVPAGGAVKQGASLEIEVTLNRRNGFEGPATLECIVPPELRGISAEPVSVPAGENQAKLVIKVANDATEGEHKFVAIRANVEQEGRKLAVDQTITLNVQKKEEENKGK